MIRVTIHMRDGRQFSVDDVQKVTQLVLGFGKGDRATARGEEILNFQFIPWRTTIVEGKTKICSVDSPKVESIEAELMDKEG